jgi:N-acyl-D-amino-acid deacylase
METVNPASTLTLSGRVARFVATGSLAAATACGPSSIGQSGDTIFTDVRLIDGTGGPERLANVRIRGDRIVEVGNLTVGMGGVEIDGNGLVLAPGFIDTHSHHDEGLSESPEALAAVSQGITTIIVGQDGGSPFPLGEFFAERETDPAAVNVGAYAGHNTLRSEVMGEDYRRAATIGEVETMRALLRRELEAGALGLSTGLEYDPGIYSTTEEVIALAREAGGVGGRYISHMRSEDRAFFEALDELIRIGREGRIPVQISHMKLAMKSLWGRTGEVLALLDEARGEGIDVTADVYPYEFWQSTMTVLFPDRNYTREAATFALEELAPPDGMIIAEFEPDTTYVGKTLKEIAASRGETAVTTYLHLIAEADSTGRSESIIARSMTTDDVAALLAWPHTNVSSDGELAGGHPRGYGAFTRVIALHVRERHDFPLETAIQKMTSLAAHHVGLVGRGTIEPGAYADLVLFDPALIADRATFAEPHQPSVGIMGVWVNGHQVYGIGGATGARPGRVLKRGGG